MNLKITKNLEQIIKNICWYQKVGWKKFLINQEQIEHEEKQAQRQKEIIRFARWIEDLGEINDYYFSFHGQLNESKNCVECTWLVFNQTPTVIFQANRIVSASGTIQMSNSTIGMSKVDEIFSKGTMTTKALTFETQQCLAFTVVGFDTITLKGNSPSSLKSASGSLCLTPRYQI